MSATLNKRQQARNERALQDLIKNVPGNNACADCQARNPGWASWSLGVFLCMRCAAIHRKLGTHITKVKSLSMDSWSTDQVEGMKQMGNVASNRIYNPTNIRPPVPIDVDEADSAMERFIRQKYMDKKPSANGQIRQNTGSTNSDDQPPPLPPKTGSKFSLRSASSIFPLSSKARRNTARADLESPTYNERSPSPPRQRRNERAVTFSSSPPTMNATYLNAKLTQLREMGFVNDKQNLAVLKGHSGNMDKAIESLTRLDRGTAPPTPHKSDSAPISRSRSPAEPLSLSGLSLGPTRDKPSPKPQGVQGDPFQRLDQPPAPVQSSQSTGTGIPANMQSQNPYQVVNTNPFGFMPSQSQYALNQTYQNQALPVSQPLFPNHTGGFPGPQPQLPFQQPITPPVPSIPQQYYPSGVPKNSTQQLPTQLPQAASYNPFMQQSVPPPSINTSAQSNPFLQQQQSQYTASPVTQSPMQQYQAQQVQPAMYGTGNQQIYQQQLQTQNPFFGQNNGSAQNVQQPYTYQSPQQVPAQQQYQPFQQQANTLAAQPTGRVDKNDIMDLFNYPQLAPAMPTQPQSVQAPMAIALPPQPISMSSNNVSVHTPTQGASNRNPFAAAAPPNPSRPELGSMGTFGGSSNGGRHVSQESISVDAGGWQNGRHSPDAWGQISARSMR